MSRVFQGCRALMAAAKSGAAKSAATSEKANIGIKKPFPVSPALKKFVGAPEVSRAEAIKKIWDHIKSNQLQILARTTRPELTPENLEYFQGLADQQ